MLVIIIHIEDNRHVSRFRDVYANGHHDNVMQSYYAIRGESFATNRGAVLKINQNNSTFRDLIEYCCSIAFFSGLCREIEMLNMVLLY